MKAVAGCGELGQMYASEVEFVWVLGFPFPKRWDMLVPWRVVRIEHLHSIYEWPELVR